MTFHIHPYTVRRYDYGDLVSVETGIVLSYDGEQVLRGTHEMGKTVSEVQERFAAVIAKHPDAGCSVVVGKPIGRSFDMNPHGLV